MLVRHSFDNPPPFEVDYAKRNDGPDRGLVNAWLSGIAMRKDKPILAQQAEAGELPVLAFRGGVAKALKTNKPKIGALLYVAMWTGLRGEDLHLDTEQEPSLQCTRHGVTVVYTHSISKLMAASQEGTEEE